MDQKQRNRNQLTKMKDNERRKSEKIKSVVGQGCQSLRDKIHGERESVRQAWCVSIICNTVWAVEDHWKRAVGATTAQSAGDPRLGPLSRTLRTPTKNQQTQLLQSFHNMFEVMEQLAHRSHERFLNSAKSSFFSKDQARDALPQTR